jgi:phage-related protein
MNEAFSTLSGSLSMAKGAWSNLVTGIADENADLDLLINNFVESVSSVASNLLPVVETALGGIGNIISGLGPKIVEAIPGLLSTVLPSLVSSATSLLGSVSEALPGILSVLFETAIPELVKGIVSAFGKLMEVLPDLIDELVNYLPTTISTLISGVTSLISSLAKALPKVIKSIIKVLPTLLEEISKSLQENVPILVEAILSMVTSILPMLPELLSIVFEVLPQVLGQLYGELIKCLPTILPLLGMFIVELAKALVGMMLTGGAMSPIGLLFNGIVGLIQALFGTDLKTKIMELLSNLWSGIVDSFNKIVSFLSELPRKVLSFLLDVIKNVIEWRQEMKDKIFGLIRDLASGLKEKAKDFLSIGTNIVDGVKKGISDAWKNLKKWFEGLFGDLVGIAKKILGIASPSKVFKKIGGFTAEGFGVGFEDEFAKVKDDMEDALNFDDASVGINASVRKVVAGAAGMAYGGSTFGDIHIHVNGGNYDENALAEALAVKLQGLTDRRAAVYA